MDLSKVVPNKTSVYCKSNPEWGTFGIRIDEPREWFTIWNSRGSRVLNFSEAEKFWEIKSEIK